MESVHCQITLTKPNLHILGMRHLKVEKVGVLNIQAFKKKNWFGMFICASGHSNFQDLLKKK